MKHSLTSRTSVAVDFEENHAAKNGQVLLLLYFQCIRISPPNPALCHLIGGREILPAKILMSRSRCSPDFLSIDSSWSIPELGYRPASQIQPSPNKRYKVVKLCYQVLTVHTRNTTTRIEISRIRKLSFLL